MTKYNFDRIIDRSDTGALKQEVLRERFGRADLLPLWVADMDFEIPSFIIDAMRTRLQHPVFGYTVEPEDYWPSVIDWIEDLHGWTVKREWLTYIPGIVKGIGMAINIFTKPGEKIIIQPPVYHPFRLVPEGNHREIVFNPLIRNEDGTYRMDLDNLKTIAGKTDSRMLILSNPHNPAGIVWDAQTLEKVAEICYENNILVLSDEIHSDMALFGYRHIPFPSVSDKAAACSITFGAPSKTFNIAGVVSSFAIVPDEDLRNRFFSWLIANELNEAPLFSPIATIAAYRHGHEWRKEMLKYVEGNIDFVIDYCETTLPEIKPLRPQASFLVWLDCKGLGLGHDQLVDFFVNKARLALNDGSMFGPGGEGFMRINIAAPRSVIKKALDRIRDARHLLKK